MMRSLALLLALAGSLDLTPTAAGALLFEEEFDVASSGATDFQNNYPALAVDGSVTELVTAGGQLRLRPAGDAFAEFARKIPQRRAGTFEDYDGALLLLASRASAHMTGQEIVVDGGHLVSSL